MRRFTAALGTLLAAGALALASALPASAAHGRLILGSQVLAENPAGCYRI